MNQNSFRCSKCGAQKRIFWPKRLKAPLTILFVLMPILFVSSFFVSSSFLKAIFGIAAFISLLVIAGLMKIRCLRCEPQWLADAWGGANYEKK